MDNIIELTDWIVNNERVKIFNQKNTVCKAIGLDKESEKILMTLKECYSLFILQSNR